MISDNTEGLSELSLIINIEFDINHQFLKCILSLHNFFLYFNFKYFEIINEFINNL
jgi:hypothetical protein